MTIKTSEVVKTLEASLRDVINGNTSRKELQLLLQRLETEVTGACSDRDLVFIELRSNLKRHLSQSFSDNTATLNSLRGVVRRFVSDLRDSEIPKFDDLIRRLERLL